MDRRRRHARQAERDARPVSETDFRCGPFFGRGVGDDRGGAVSGGPRPSSQGALHRGEPSVCVRARVFSASLLAGVDRARRVTSDKTALQWVKREFVLCTLFQTCFSAVFIHFFGGSCGCCGC